MSSITKAFLQTARSRGQILPLFAGSLIVILLMAALAFDVGMMIVERRDQQNAADAAALAGARYVLSDPAAARTAAQQVVETNGFADADPDETVNIYIPAIHGRYASLPGFIEVQIEATRPSIFGGVIGRTMWPVGAFAVATNHQDLSFPFSMIALDPSACKAIAVSGSGEINAIGTIQSNSSGQACGGTNPKDWIAFSRTGGSTINVGNTVYCRALGEIQDKGSGDMDCTKDPAKFALPDPLQGLPEPTKPGLAPAMQYVGPGTAPTSPPKWCPGNTIDAPKAAASCDLGSPSSPYANRAWILYPGLYPGGLKVTAGTTAYLMPGVYWIGGDGIRVADGSIMSINVETDAKANVADVVWEPVRADPMTSPNGLGGVLIYNSDDPPAGGPVVFDGSGAVMKLMPLKAPAGSPEAIYNNIVIFQDRTLTASLTLNGSSSNTIVAGLIYAPTAQIKLNGNGGSLTVGQVMAGTFDITGNTGNIYVTDQNLFKAIIKAAGLVD